MPKKATKSAASRNKNKSPNNLSESKKIETDKFGVRAKIRRFKEKLRNSKARITISKYRDIYPVIIFALMPVLYFWTKNNIQELGPSVMTRALLAAVLVGLAYYFAWYFALKRNKYKASILAILTIVITFTYGQLQRLYEKIAPGVLDADRYFILLLLVLYIGVAYLIIRKLKYSHAVRNYLAIFATVLLILNLYPLVKHWATNYGLSNQQFGPDIGDSNVEDAKKPDIFYLVFDRYANEQVLKGKYGFDNTPFLNSLRDRGFYVASDSAANYPFTTFSLTTSLNLDYVPESFKNRSENGLYYILMKDKMENNNAATYLKDQGYNFVNIGPWWNPTKYNKNADQDLYYPAGLILLTKTIDLKEHELALFEDTILWPFFSKLPMKLGPHTVYGTSFPQVGESSGRVIHRESIMHQFEQLKKVSETPSPKFVFAHFLFPHDPYVLDENCQPYKSRYTDEQVVYLNQLKCANQKIAEVVDFILEHNETDPIIIVQSDEGPYPKEFRENKQLDWSKAPTDQLRQKAMILNAYHFPDGNYERLYQSISPVNSLRLIFDQYLGTDLGLLEDRHYFQESEKRRFFLHDLTDKFPQ